MLTFGTPIVSYVTGVDKDAKNTENRTKATFDAVKVAKYVDVAEKFDEYYNDNLPLRSTIINTWSGLKFSIFGEIKSNNVISGKADGSKAKTWLFYEADSDHNPVRTATGIDQYPDTIKQALILESRPIPRMPSSTMSSFTTCSPLTRRIFIRISSHPAF